MKDKKVKEAFEVIRQAMIDDNPSEQGSYAHSWHCNIAMACYDAIKDSHNDKQIHTHYEAHEVANDAASRFMKMCFDVETSN